MECKYYFSINPDLEYDYEQIVNLILQKGDFPEDISDILFSENQNRRDAIIEKLNKIKYDYKERTIGSDKDRLQEAVLTGFDFEYGNSKTLTIQLFLSSDKCTIGENKERLYTPINIEALKLNLIKKYVDSGLSQTEAELKVASQIEHYSTIEGDARLVHELISFHDLSGRAATSFYNLFLDSSTDDLKVRISRSVIENFYNDLSQKFWKGIVLTNFTGNLKDSIKKGFNIESDLIFDGGEKLRLSGHIDYLVVDKNGYLNLYNFVTSSKEKWNRDKEEFYRLKLITLKRMLLNNGINVDGIKLYNIPIYISYDDNNETINDISVGTEKQIYIDYARGSSLLDKDYQLSKFIKSSINFKFSTNDKVTDKLRGAFTSIFPPDINLDVDGLHKSVREWIKYAPQEDESKSQLVIKYIGEPNKQYEVYIAGKKVADIKSNARRENNQEIIDVVLEHLNELYDNSESIANDMYSAIYSAYTNGKITKLPLVCEHLSQYIYDRDLDGKPNWELIDDLIQYHILLFKKGDNVDVVYLGTSFLNLEIDFKNGQHNLLGYVKPDIDSIELRGTHGNLYSITALLILNEYLPSLNLEEFKLGKIRVLSSQGTNLTQYQYNVLHLVKKYFNPIIKEINARDSNLDVKNNFVQAKFADPMQSIVEQLKVVLNDSGTRSEIQKAIASENWEELLLKVQSNKSKELLLKHLLDFITATFFEDSRYYTPKKILELAKENKNNPAALLYKMVSDAYLLYSNQSLEYDPVIDKMLSLTIKPAYISSRNARLIVNNYRAMLNAMSDDINDGYDEYIHDPVMEYYKAIGYTALLNSTVGMLAKVFKNMFEVEDGKRTMYFKNPYSEGSDLTDPEKKFLKRAIFLFNKFLKPDFVFKDENDLTFIDKVNSDKSFLLVPLLKASSDTEFLTNFGSKIDRVKEYIKNRKNILDELYYKIDDTVRKAKNMDLSDDADVFSHMHVGNKFLLGTDSRDHYIREKGPEYFETNIEDLLVDVLGEVVEVEKTNSFLVSTKAILLLLELMKQDYSESNDIVKKELEYISDYLKVNVFKKPLSKGTAEKILAFLMPLRKFVVDANLAGNLVGFFRDLENGFIENYWRTVSHHLTDITRLDLVKAYVKFFGEAAFSNPMKVNLLNKLCTVYRISNVDLARITERLKTGRAGLSNYENWLYATLRAPDFLHRMTLFMAKCIHDGVIDEDDSKSAFYIENNRLKYDWKKDKRFSHLAKGDKSDPLYDDELGRYITLIDIYNAEHPDRDPIPYYKDEENRELSDVPSPYTEGEIQSIKEVGSNIYGDYDRSNKALGEFHMIGLIFAMYTTWMNGIIVNMAMKPGQYSPNPRIWTHAEDAEGKLYRNPNNFQSFVHESDLKEGDRRIPVYEEELSMAQGVLPTLNSLYYYLKDGGIPAAMDYIKANPNVKALMKKELIDLLMTGLWLILYKLIFDPEYKDRKKQAEGQLILSNFITEVIYKSTRASFDTFKGPWNIVQYLGDQMNPPVWQVPTTLIGDMYRMVLGDKTFYQVLTGNFGFARAFRDTYSMYKRDVLQ